MRTSCREFSLDDLSDAYVHLTNDAVQKNCPDYGKYETANKMAPCDFQRYIDTDKELRKKKINFERDFFP